MQDEDFCKGKDSKKERKKKATGNEFFAEAAPALTVPPERQAKQQALDASIQAAVDKVPALAKYLKARFTLSKHDAPHKMKF